MNLNKIIDFAIDTHQVKAGHRDSYRRVIDMVLWMIEKGADPDTIHVERNKDIARKQEGETHAEIPACFNLTQEEIYTLRRQR